MQSLKEHLISEFRAPGDPNSPVKEYWDGVYAQYLTALAAELTKAEYNKWDETIDNFLNAKPSGPISITHRSAEWDILGVEYRDTFNISVVRSAISSRIHTVCTAYLEKSKLNETSQANEIQLF